MELFACFFVLGIWGIGIFGTVFWVWMLIDAVTKEPTEGNDKIMWVLIIVLTHLVGALIYYFLRRPERMRRFGM